MIGHKGRGMTWYRYNKLIIDEVNYKFESWWTNLEVIIDDVKLIAESLWDN